MGQKRTVQSVAKTRVFSHGKSSTAALSQWYVIILSNHVLKNVPKECEARLEIVDAWKTGNGKNKPKRWGFVGKIKIPKEVIDNNKHFSVLIRFSKKVTHGHFQLWNMNFWNFYNGGYEVLIHSKHWKTDR